MLALVLSLSITFPRSDLGWLLNQVVPFPMAEKFSLFLVAGSWPSLDIALWIMLFKIFPAGVVPWGQEEEETLLDLYLKRRQKY